MGDIPWSGDMPRNGSSSFDLGDVEFWVTYYPEKTEAKVNFGWRCLRSGVLAGLWDPPCAEGGV